MGLCGSKDAQTGPQKALEEAEKKKTKILDKEAEDANNKDMAVHKLLLLGAGESGKSTLFKQMITIYGTGFSERERKAYQPMIYENVIAAMKALVAAAPHWGGGYPKCKASAEFVEAMGETDVLNLEKIAHFKALWQDPTILEAYKNSSKFQLPDSTAYFFGKFDEIVSPGFIPSEADVLRTRVRTTGIVENEFEIQGNKFKMYDVGGQRNERKKWIHCFEKVTAVLFVGVLSEYDMVLYEDEKMNRMDETLNLFDEICNSRWFRETDMILFLNKRDLFQDKIKRVPLKVCPVFRDYAGENTYEAGCQLIESAFHTKNKNPEKKIYVHLTCATDTSNMRAVFVAIKDIIIRRSLGAAGLIG
jgi:GTPase SAR1 family protein